MPLIRVSLCVALAAAVLPAQPRAQRSELYGPTLNRLGAMTTLPVVQWRSHADMPHGEDPSLDDSTWTAEVLSGGRGGRGAGGAGGTVAWHRTTLEIPRLAGACPTTAGSFSMAVW